MLLAVSGGPDSTALLHAAATSNAPVPLHVATVDHGLRAESAAEADGVAALAQRLDLPHATLRWSADKPETGLQAAARAARYALLAGHAVRIGADLVLTGHTADDQAETVLMRLVAGSGPAGLGGMRSRRPLGPGVTLGRPFLALGKAELVAYCEAHGLPVVHDPSNRDDRFGRVRLRRLLPVLAGEGLTAGRLCTLSARVRRDDDALARIAAAALDAALLSDQAGRIALDGRALAEEPDAVLVRAIDAAITRVEAATGQRVAKRLERLEDLVLGALRPALEAGRPMRRTLRGVLVEASAEGRVSLCQAPMRRPGPARA